jgi:hypothetical protein
MFRLSELNQAFLLLARVGSQSRIKSLLAVANGVILSIYPQILRLTNSFILISCQGLSRSLSEIGSPIEFSFVIMSPALHTPSTHHFKDLRGVEKGYCVRIPQLGLARVPAKGIPPRIQTCL